MTPLTAGTALASLLVLPVVLRLLFRAVREKLWTSTTSLVVLAGLVGGLPTAVSNIVSPHPETYDAFGDVVVGLTGWAAQLEQLLTAATLLGSVAFIAVRAARYEVVPAPWAATGLVVAAALSTVLHGHASDVGVRTLALLAVLLAAGLGDRGRPAFLGAATVCLFYTLLGGLQAAVHPADAFRACRVDKCGLAGALYSGAFSNENTFGLTLALSGSFVWLALRGRARLVLVLYVVGSVVLTGSRTAMAAAVALVVALVLLRPDVECTGSVGTGGRRVMAALLVGGAGAIAALFPLLVPPATVGDRFSFWQLALRGVAADPVLGLGGTAWSRLYEKAQIPISGSYSPHNQWLDLLYASGVVGVVLFGVLLVWVMAAAGRYAPVWGAVLFPVLVASTLERPWSFAANDGLTFTLVAALLAPVAAAGRPARRDPRDLLHRAPYPGLAVEAGRRELGDGHRA